MATKTKDRLLLENIQVRLEDYLSKRHPYDFKDLTEEQAKSTYALAPLKIWYAWSVITNRVDRDAPQ